MAAPDQMPKITKPLARGSHPHRVTGVHVAVDDAKRRAFAGVPGDARKTTTTAFLLPALRWIRCHGIGAERVMADAGWLSLHGLAVRSQEVVQLKRG